jgi:hypothetical protein
MKVVMVKLIIQEKNIYSTKKEFSLLGKSSGLIPLASSPGIGPLCSGLCGEECCPLARQLGVEMAGGFFSFFCLPWPMGHPLQVGVLKWSHQVTVLQAVFGSFCPQSRLQLGPEVTHCQFMQGGQI